MGGLELAVVEKDARAILDVGGGATVATGRPPVLPPLLLVVLLPLLL